MTGGTGASRAEVCAVACAEVWRGSGEILASPLGGAVPVIGARLAKLTFAPELLLTDGEAMLMADVPALGAQARVVEGWLPYRRHLELATGGRRHALLGASQLDRHGNQNISCIGDWKRPERQLIGMRGLPVNTLNHPVSYWIPRHSPRVLVERVDVVCGVGHDRAAAAGPAATRFHRLVRVVTDLAVLDFETPDRTLRVRSLHPGVAPGALRAATGFPLAVPADVPRTRVPTPAELRLIRDVLDPDGLREREVPSS
ncbi:CoA-transferase subunit beta [Streptomyces cinnamoneus]|uniref:CoA-transferase subunit beta n=1 Tax=Streptomyces cinnamoneus TaxID=53446 RepID=UPI000CEF3C15|nr:CoA-transferase [Streptomyces cinnamoneus]PPT16061.1 CoA-transferase [Streptomyces cinnamoneus]